MKIFLAILDIYFALVKYGRNALLPRQPPAPLKKNFHISDPVFAKIAASKDNERNNAMEASQHVTIEKTAKKFKAQKVLSVILFLIGLVWAACSNAAFDAHLIESKSIAPYVVMLSAAVWWIVNRIRIWWNHG